jgi:hypothetical protein
MPEHAAPCDPLQPVKNGINLLNEKSLHADLKQWYALPDDQMEVPVDGYIIDLVRGDLLIEIQTGSFHPLKRKLARLAETHTVRLVFPIAQEKWIIREAGEGGGRPGRRKSPLHGRVEHVFSQLVYIPDLLSRENFSLEVLLIREEEVRRFDASKARAWRRKGWVTSERRLVEVVDRREFHTPADLVALLPAGLPVAFTARELAKNMGLPVWLAHKMIYCLKKLDRVAPAGRKGRATRYCCVDQTPL